MNQSDLSINLTWLLAAAEETKTMSTHQLIQGICVLRMVGGDFFCSAQHASPSTVQSMLASSCISILKELMAENLSRVSFSRDAEGSYVNNSSLP